MSRATINRLGLFSSATVAASLPATPLTMANAIQTLTQTVTTDNSFANGFGASVVGDLDVINATGKDLVTSFPGAVGGGTVLVYADLTAAGAAGGNPSLTVVGPLTFGFKVAAASVNTADGRPDLLVALGLTASNSAWMLYQSAGTFETSIGGATPAFQVSRFDGAALSGGTNTSLGRANALGDINGDALTDVVLGDDRANQVRIWR